MAVYNEAETVATAIERVLAVDIQDVEVELIVVESNSSDGTREIVSRYAADPSGPARPPGRAERKGRRRPRGVRARDRRDHPDPGRRPRVLRGRLPELIEPIMRGEVDFTLGCRHVPGQPVRVMDESRFVALVVNAAHWVFTWLFNITYGTKLRDPFTMYKVFRSECIEGVEFVADRFDFDWELAGEARAARVQAGRDSGRVQRAFLRRGQEGSVLPRPAHLGRRLPPVSLLLSPCAASRRHAARGREAASTTRPSSRATGDRLPWS